MSDRKLCWKKIGRYNVFIVASIAADGFVSFSDPYRHLLDQYLGLAGKKLPTEAGPEWFDGITDLPVEYEV